MKLWVQVQTSGISTNLAKTRASKTALEIRLVLVGVLRSHGMRSLVTKRNAVGRNCGGIKSVLPDLILRMYNVCCWSAKYPWS